MRNVLVLCVIACTAATMVFAEGVQESEEPYPSDPIEVVVPFSAGGVTDTLTRVLEMHDDGHVPNDQPLVVVN